MGRAPIFHRFARLIANVLHCEKQGRVSRDAKTLLAAVTQRTLSLPTTRRAMLGHFGAAGTTVALGTLTGLPRPVLARPVSTTLNVGIVGAGLAGLACADQLKQHGVRATLYEAAARTGGRCWSSRGFFPGQVAERGGEFIDNLHKTMLGYARRFGLAKEDVTKLPGETFYHFAGQRYAEAAVVAEFRDFVAVMRSDLRRLSSEVTAATHTANDVRLDRTNLLAYLEGENGEGVPAGPLAKAAIVEAYEAEYGLAAEEQSCLNFLLFIHADRRSKFTPFGVFSDERYHLLDGNDRIVEGLTAELAGQIEYETLLIRVRRDSIGRIELTLRKDSQTIIRAHEAVVLAIPFSILRHIDLDPNLGLPAGKLLAIRQLGYGTNAKTMVGFSGRPWIPLGGNGTSYSDLPNLQTTWETNPTLGTAARGILTDYSSGTRGTSLNPNALQTEVERFLTDLDVVYPGARGAATRIGTNYLVHMEHWPSNPLSRGSYTCYTPGQFTTIAGLEGTPVGNLFFAGEHASSFYEWQGFMEGAALSGIQAAKDILVAARVS